MIAVIMVRYKEVKLTNQKKKGMHGELTIEQIQEDFGRKQNVIECDVCEHQAAEVEGLLSKEVNASESSKCWFYNLEANKSRNNQSQINKSTHYIYLKKW